jgi:hypothetical protein
MPKKSSKICLRDKRYQKLVFEHVPELINPSLARIQIVSEAERDIEVSDSSFIS